MKRLSSAELIELINLSLKDNEKDTLKAVNQKAKEMYDTELSNVELNFVIEYVRKYGKV